MSLPSPVIFVPGITATRLRDEYPLSPDAVWTVFRKDYERIVPHPDDLRYEAVEPARVRPDRLLTVNHAELIEELRYNLAAREDRPVPVFPFAYDWRQPLARVEEELRAFVAEVIGRTRLLRHYHREGFGDAPRVNLVAHSMGGLVVAGALERYGRALPVDRVVSIGTPFRGSFEAVVKMLTGTADLGAAAPGSREREMARLTPSLYHLIPSFGDNGRLFEPGCWQASIIDTLAEFIRRKGLPVRARRQKARELFASLLAQARAHRDRLESFRLESAGLGPDRWLAVAGVDATTRVRVGLRRRGDRCAFDLSSSDRENRWDSGEPEERRLTGDGTVPYDGAVPPFLEERRLVLVTPGDFGYWELRDRALSMFAGFHGLLPTMDLVHRLVVRFLKGAHDSHGNTWGRPAPGVAPADWRPPLKLRVKG